MTWCAWQQQLGVFPTFTLVKGMQTEEPGGGEEEREVEAEVCTALRHATQEPVNTEPRGAGRGVAVLSPGGAAGACGAAQLGDTTACGVAKRNGE